MKTFLSALIDAVLPGAAWAGLSDGSKCFDTCFSSEAWRFLTIRETFKLNFTAPLYLQSAHALGGDIASSKGNYYGRTLFRVVFRLFDPSNRLNGANGTHWERLLPTTTAVAHSILTY